jgi:hypothetical protein
VFDQLDATLWTVMALVALAAFLAGVAVTAATLGIRATKRELRDATVAERIETAKERGVDTRRGVAALPDEPESAGPLTPMELPRRAGLVPVPDRMLTMPTVAEHDATTLVADFPAPGNVEPESLDLLVAEELTRAEACAEALDGKGDLTDLLGIEPAEPGDDAPDEDTPPAAASTEPAAPMLTILSPRPVRYWSADRWPWWAGVLPPMHKDYDLPGLLTRRRIKVRRLYSPLRVWLAGHMPSPVRRAWNAAHELDPQGFRPGEATALIRSGPPTPSLPSRRRHVGTHRPEAVAQRTLRRDWRDTLQPAQVPSMPGWGRTP